MTGVAKGFAAGDNAKKAAEARWGKKAAKNVKKAVSKKKATKGKK